MGRAVRARSAPTGEWQRPALRRGHTGGRSLDQKTAMRPKQGRIRSGGPFKNGPGTPAGKGQRSKRKMRAIGPLMGETGLSGHRLARDSRRSHGVLNRVSRGGRWAAAGHVAGSGMATRTGLGLCLPAIDRSNLPQGGAEDRQKEPGPTFHPRGACINRPGRQFPSPPLPARFDPKRQLRQNGNSSAGSRLKTAPTTTQTTRIAVRFVLPPAAKSG
jgi:hypothetical protein